MSSDAIDAALHYKWPLLKLSKPTDKGPSPGKRPLQKNWETIDGLTAAEARAWLAEDGNIGIRTGGSLLVVDCDGERPDNLPDTPTVQTGSGGMHLYYRVPDGIKLRVGNTAKWIHPTTDTRGDGGQVVAPGSIHAGTGALYEWMPGLSPAEITITPLPQWVIDAINNPNPPPWREKPKTATAAQPSRYVQHESPYIAAAISRAIANVLNAPEGTRNETLNREAYSLAGLPGVEPIDHLLSPAITSGLQELESRASIASGTRAGRDKPRTLPAPSAIATATLPAPAATAQPDAMAMPDGYVTGPSPRELAEKYLTDVHPEKTLHYWRGDWYRYVGTHYARYTGEELHRDLSRVLSGWHYFSDRNGAPKPVKAAIKDGLIRDVVSQLRGMTLISPEREVPCWLDNTERPPARQWLALQNGLLSMTPGRDLIPHTPALFNTQALSLIHI